MMHKRVLGADHHVAVRLDQSLEDKKREHFPNQVETSEAFLLNFKVYVEFSSEINVFQQETGGPHIVTSE